MPLQPGSKRKEFKNDFMLNGGSVIKLGGSEQRPDVKEDNLMIDNSIIPIDDGIQIADALAALGCNGMDEGVEEGVGIGEVRFKI